MFQETCCPGMVEEKEAECIGVIGVLFCLPLKMMISKPVLGSVTRGIYANGILYSPGFLLQSYSGDGIETINPTLGRGLDS